MSPRLTAADRRILIGAGLVSMLLVVVTALLAPRADGDERATTYSSRSGGTRAAFQLLARLGYDVRRWEQPLTDLSSVPEAVLILADPEILPSEEERGALRSFVERGGRVIATGPAGALALPDRLAALARDPAGGSLLTRVPARAPSRAARAAPVISLAPQVYVPAPGSSGLTLYGVGDKVYVTSAAIGDGEAMWWAASTPMTNAGLRETGNLEFTLAALNGIEGPILWDEYVHGYRGVPPPPANAAVVWAGVHLVLLAAAVLVTYSRRSGPLLPARAEHRLSPLEFVETLAALYQRAGAAPVAVEIAYQRFTFELRKRTGLPADASIEEMVRAAGARWPGTGPALGDLLRACEAAAHNSQLTPTRALTLTRALAAQTRSHT